MEEKHMPDNKNSPGNPGFSGNDVRLDPSPREVFLDFQLEPASPCTLTTRWPFPLTHACCVMAVFSAGAFDIPGGREVRVDLLYSLERKFCDWSERHCEPRS